MFLLGHPASPVQPACFVEQALEPRTSAAVTRRLAWQPTRVGASQVRFGEFADGHLAGLEPRGMSEREVDADEHVWVGAQAAFERRELPGAAAAGLVGVLAVGARVALEAQVMDEERSHRRKGALG